MVGWSRSATKGTVKWSDCDQIFNFIINIETIEAKTMCKTLPYLVTIFKGVCNN